MIRRLFSSQLRINMVSGVSSTTISFLANIIAYPVYLHFLGYETFGVWLILATVLTFTQLGTLGIAPGVTKLIAEDYNSGNLRGVQSYVFTAMAFLFSFGISIFLIILLLKSQIIALFKLSDGNAELASHFLPYIGALTILALVMQVLTATLSGLGRMDIANYIQASSRVLAVVVSVILLLSGFGIMSLVISSLLQYIYIQVISVIFIHKTVSVQLMQISNWDTLRLKKLLHFGGGIFGGGIISMLLSPFNKLMLSRYVGLEAIPVYEIAYYGAFQCRSLLEAGFRALMPEVSKLQIDQTAISREKIHRINKKAFYLIVIIGTPFYILLFLLSTPLLKLWLQDRFVDALPPAFRIMLVGTFFTLLMVPSLYILMGFGQTKRVFFSYVIQSVINVLIVFISLLCFKSLTINTVVLAASIGMMCSMIYVIWQKKILIHKFSAE